MEILYVEDDVEDIELFSEALSNIDANIKFCYAINAKQASENLNNNSIKPDAIFVDAHLPGIDGYDFVSSLKVNEQFRDVPVVILSTTIESRQVDKFNRIGVYYFLSKSALLADLEPALRVIINSLCKGEEQSLDEG